MPSGNSQFEMMLLAPTVTRRVDQPSTPRFTLDGNDELEDHLRQVCHAVLGGVRRVVPEHTLEAVILAGGYGRGEGGVLNSESGDWPYNDLEFYVCLRGNRFLN